MTNIIPAETIAAKIYLVRGIKVMLDRDLAELYGVETRWPLYCLNCPTQKMH